MICIICIIYVRSSKSWSFLFFGVYFKAVLLGFVEMIADDWKDWRLICDNRIHLKDLCHLHHPHVIIQKLEFSDFLLCILKLFCWFLFRFVEMIADDWKDWRLICDNRIHLKDLYHLVSSASSTCDHQKSWSFLFFCCVFESCFVRFRFVLFRWLQMIKKIEDWFAIIFIWNIYIICIIIQKLKFSVFFNYIRPFH